MPPLLLCCWADLINGIPIPPLWAQRHVEGGFDGVRLTIYGKTVCTAPGVLDLALVDQSIDTLVAAGFKAENIIANPFTLPSFMSGGNPTYGFLVPDTARFTNPGKSLDFVFDDSKAYLTNPVTPNAPMIIDYAYKLTMHLIAKGVRIFSTWNEFDNEVFWSPWWQVAHRDGGNWSPSARRYDNEITSPFVIGFRRAANDAGVGITILGPENATQEVGHTILAFADGASHSYHGIAHHVYPPSGNGFPQASIDEADRRIVRYADLMNGRKHWFTEVSPDGGRTPEQYADDVVVFYRAMVARADQVAAFALYNTGEYLFVDQHPNQLDRWKYVPSAAWYALRDEVAKTKGRHRGAKS